MDITEHIGVGKQNAVTRAELVAAMGVCDRAVRNLIEDARREGTIIINTGDGKGYYLSDDVEDLKRQYKLNQSRAMSVLVQQKFLRRRIKELETRAGS